MYIHPFVAGVFATIFAEIVAMVISITIYQARGDKK